MSYTVDSILLGDLEEIFRVTFLESAPLYKAARKIKLGYEDIHRSAVMYRGALENNERVVEEFMDFDKCQPEEFNTKIRGLAVQAGHAVDFWIRRENRKSISGDTRDTANLVVTDIFNHADGRRNLQIGAANTTGSITEPGLQSWVYYKFYFAAASIQAQYKIQTIQKIQSYTEHEVSSAAPSAV